MVTLTKTVRCKLDPTAEQKEALIDTIRVYSKALNSISETAHEHRGVSNKVALHHLVYYDTRDEFPDLPAQYVVTAYTKVAEAYKREKEKLHTFKPYAGVRLDARTFNLRTDDETVSVSSVEGRQRWIPLDIGDYQRQFFTDEWERTGAAELIYDGSCGYLFVNIVVSKEVDDPEGEEALGVDRGLNNIAVTSDGQFYSGKRIGHIRNTYSERRRSLQAKGTRNSKRVLQRLSKRENRFMANENHRISKRIVDHAQKNNQVIVFEDLKHIRNRIRANKKQRYRLHGWAFYQLQEFIEYKALAAGVPVVYIDPRYTSQRCSQCGHVLKSQRNSHSFKCQQCGYQANADFNAALNIAGSYTLPADGGSSTSPEVASEMAKTDFGNCAIA